MKKIGDITKGMDLTRHKQEVMDIDTETMDVVDKLFNDLIGAFPAFKQAWPTTDVMDSAKRIWTLAFIKEGFCDVEAIKKGIIEYALLKNPFIPTAGQFIEMCRTRATPAYHREYIALPKSTTTREAALSHLSKIKEILK